MKPVIKAIIELNNQKKESEQRKAPKKEECLTPAYCEDIC